MTRSSLTKTTLLIAGLAGCSGGSNQKPPSYKIASAFDITGGTVDAVAPTWENAAVLAVEQVNASGGIRGRNLELVKNDSGSKADLATTRLQETWDQFKVPGVLTGISVVSVGVADNFASKNGVLQICTACTTPGMTEAHGGGMLLRTSPSADLQGPILAKHVHDDLHFTKVALAHSDDPFGMGIAKSFKDAFVALGGTVTLDLPHPQAVKASYADDLNQLQASAPEAIFLGTFINNTVKFIQDWETGGYTTPFVFPHTARVQTLLTNVPDLTRLEGMGGSSNVAKDGAEGDKFQAAYKARFADSDVTLFTATAYDAAMTLALALEAAGKEQPTGADLKAALPRLNDPAAEVVGVNDFAHARQLLESGKNINYTGASGPVDFDATGSAHGRFVIWNIQGGKFVDLGVTNIP